MKSTDFIKESALDQAIQQAQNPQKKLPPSGGKAAGAIATGIRGVGQAAGFVGKNLAAGAGVPLSAATRLHKSSYGQPAVGKVPGEEIAYTPGKPDPNVTSYLKKAAGNQPLTSKTGNKNIDDLLVKAGLVK